VQQWHELIEKGKDNAPMMELQEATYQTVIKSDPYTEKSDRFLTIIDSEEMEGITPEDFRKFFCGSSCVDKFVGCNKDTVGGGHVLTETGDVHTHYVIVDVKIPFVAARYVCNTLYEFWNYKG
jgi:hypothetical protein